MARHEGFVVGLKKKWGLASPAANVDRSRPAGPPEVAAPHLRWGGAPPEVAAPP